MTARCARQRRWPSAPAPRLEQRMAEDGFIASLVSRTPAGGRGLLAFSSLLRSCKSCELVCRVEHHAISGGWPTQLSAGTGHVPFVPKKLFQVSHPAFACDGVDELFCSRSPRDCGCGMLLQQGVPGSPGALSCSLFVA